MLTYEPYNALVLGIFFARMMRVHPGLQVIGQRFIALAKEEANGCEVLEIGMGNGGLAIDILSTSSAWHYTGLEPDTAALPPLGFWLWSDPRFEAVTETFQTWEPKRHYQLVVSRFTSHHFPGEIESWYSRIADCLEPGGTFLQLDMALPTPGYSLNWLIETARTINESPSRDSERDRWISHMLEDERNLLTVPAHNEALYRAGLSPRVAGQWEHQTIWHCTRR